MIWLPLGCHGDLPTQVGSSSDADGDGYSFAQGDCDDHDGRVHPTAPDQPDDGLDSDCDGTDARVDPLEGAGRFIVTGRAADRLGSAIDCSSRRVGSYRSAVAAGAQTERDGYRPGYAVLFEGTRAGWDTDSDADWRVNGTGYDYLGTRVSFPGDTDGDGAEELLVTAMGAYRPEGQSGAAFLFDLASGGTFVPEDAGVWFQGGEGAAMLGGAARAGDLDEDGLDDVLLGATFLNWGEREGEIRVHAAATLAPEAPPEQASVRVPGLDPVSPTGLSMLVADLDADGAPDLVHSEYEWEGRGRIVVLPGPASEWPTATPLFVEGIETATFGLVVSAGDLNADGVADLVTGCHTCAGGGDRRGEARVYFGPVDASRTADDSDVTVRGETDWAWMGASQVVIDHDGDGVDDLVVSAPSDMYFGPPRAGLVYVFWGPLDAGELDPRAADVVYRGIEAYDRTGWTLAGCDLDADGDDELVLGAPGNADGVAEAGRVIVVDGGD